MSKSIANKANPNNSIITSDFVPVAKLARREGVDFVLDNIRNNISPSLFEHIDGLKSTCPKDNTSENT